MPTDEQDAPPGPFRPGRRAVLGTGAGLALLGAGGLGYHRLTRPDTTVPLYAETVAWSGPGRRVEVPVGETDRLVPGTRVLRSAPDRSALVGAGRGWVRRVPAALRTDERFGGLVGSAMLDLQVLTVSSGTTVAGWAPLWRYVWPRDSAHVAVALGLAGHRAEAVAQVRRIGTLPRADRAFQARYRPDGSGPPDDRPQQLDGVGWHLWAVGVLQDAGVLSRRELAAMAGPVRASARAALELFDSPDDLPPPSPDYWEVDESRPTLGLTGALHAGLDRSLPALRLVDAGLAAQVGARLPAIRAAVEAAYGDHGYQRYGDDGGADTAVCFTVPPYTGRPLRDAQDAVRQALPRLRQPAGGVTPGESWKPDRISWTPETAIFATALAASPEASDRRSAARLLDVLARHRTAAGALPEKVLADGSAASVAPLAWTAAGVLLAARLLQTRQ